MAKVTHPGRPKDEDPHVKCTTKNKKEVMINLMTLVMMMMTMMSMMWTRQGLVVMLTMMIEVIEYIVPDDLLEELGIDEMTYDELKALFELFDLDR